MMTLGEMKLAVCEKLPELIEIESLKDSDGAYKVFVWKKNLQSPHGDNLGHDIHWPTEGLQVCHEAEKLLGEQVEAYFQTLSKIVERNIQLPWNRVHATYEQRLKALCHVWWPERFEK